MTPEQAIESELHKLDDELAPIEQQRSRLLARRLSLLTALSALASEPDQFADSKEAPQVAHRSNNSLPRQWAILIEALGEYGLGIGFGNLWSEFQRRRGKPIAEASFAAQLSKMKTAQLIHKRDDRWFKGPEKETPEATLPGLNEGPADGSQGRATHLDPEGSIPSGSTDLSGQKGGDGDAPATS